MGVSELAAVVETHTTIGGDDRQPHLVGGVDGRLLGIRTALDVGGDVLEHHDGVVDDHTDGDGERRERDDVERRPCGEQVDERTDQRHGDGHADDERGAPTSEEDHDDEHHEDEGVHDRFGQRTDGVGDLLRRLVDELHLDVLGQRTLDFGQAALDLVHDVDGVRTRLLLEDDAHAALAVDALVHGGLLERIADLGHVGEHDGAAAEVRNHNLAQLVGELELAVGLDVEGVVADVDAAAGDVDILGGDDLAELLDREPVGVELRGVDVDLDLTLGSTDDRHGAHAVDTVQNVDQLVVQNLVERRIALVGRDGEHHHRDHRRGELEDRGIVDVVGQHRLHARHHVADFVGALVEVGTVFELDGDHRDVVLRLRRQLLEVVHRVEVVLQHTRDVGLDVGGVGAGIHRDDRNLGDFDLGILVHGQVHEREESEDDHAHEQQDRGDRFAYRAFVDFHGSGGFNPVLRILWLRRRASTAP